MLVSMTGYGYGEAESPEVKIQVELKSVNHRFCDVQVRIPREYMALEPRVVGLARAAYSRGRVELFIRRVDLIPHENHVQFNLALARQYHRQLTEMKAALNLAGEIDLSVLLGLDGVTETVEVFRDAETDWPLVQQAVSAALASADRMRRQEGDAILRDLEERIALLRDFHRQMTELSRTTRQDAQQRLQNRVQEALARANAGEIDHGRLMQEVVYLMDRVDISEELTRFDSHLVQLSALLKEEQPVGRKIEFLLQELLRVANTIGSKTSTPDITRCGMLIKVELEKIREQIQNIE
jgi:uncharacterized protein (TIGR00255 family)